MTNPTDWEPSEEMMHVVANLLQDWYSEKPTGDYPAHEADIILIAVRPLIIAEAHPQIEAAERERVLEEAAKWLDLAAQTSHNLDKCKAFEDGAQYIRALKPKP